MNFAQHTFKLNKKNRGFHLITDEIINNIDIKNINIGTLNLFLQHTSASLCLNENCDPSVRDDMESFFNEVVSEDKSYYIHTYEGSDDMPAHIKSAIMGISLTIPITKGRLNLGTWQGIYQRNDN